MSWHTYSLTTQSRGPPHGHSIQIIFVRRSCVGPLFWLLAAFPSEYIVLDDKSSMNTSGIFLSMFARILFAGFLAITTFLAILMIGFSGDSGFSPVFIYLCVSTLLFAGTGIVILVTPFTSASPLPRGYKVLVGLFVISMVQPFWVAGVVKMFFTEPAVKNTAVVAIKAPATICVSQKSSDPNNIAWIDIAVGDASYSRFPENPALGSGQTACNSYYVKPLETVKIRAYTSTPANAVEYWTEPGPGDVVSGTLEEKISPKEQLCIAVSPVNTIPTQNTSWTSGKIQCSR